jgi:deazaflavin-dependent oxidoreductase (nitroreductase family)
MTEQSERDLLQDIKERSEQHLQLYLESDGEDARLPDSPILVLTTTGRRSGQKRSTPLRYGRDGDNFVLVGSVGGASRHPFWYLNLCENPEVEVQLKSRHIPAIARVAAADERERLWALVTSSFPPYAAYQSKTERLLPVVIVEPRGRG